jgi:hypothetical protein
MSTLIIQRKLKMSHPSILLHETLIQLNQMAFLGDLVRA